MPYLENLCRDAWRSLQSLTELPRSCKTNASLILFDPLWSSLQDSSRSSYRVTELSELEHAKICQVAQWPLDSSLGECQDVDRAWLDHVRSYWLKLIEILQVCSMWHEVRRHIGWHWMPIWQGSFNEAGPQRWHVRLCSSNAFQHSLRHQISSILPKNIPW